MKNVLNLTFESSLSHLREINSSFDAGVLQVAYHGRNRNGSAISKAAFERSMDTIWNCPVVCNYDRETDTIGSHDVELVEKDGKMCLVNVTQPVGVVPESAATYWKEIEEADGTKHEYLCVDVLLWKRQEAYRKIVGEENVSQSMEISVKEGELIDDVFNINRFEFTAFCLLGSAEPCFESASLELFSRNDFQRQFSEMMADAKRTISEMQSASQVDLKSDSCMEGGDFAMEEMNVEVTETNIDSDSIEVVEVVEAEPVVDPVDPAVEVTADPEPTTDPVAEPIEAFALSEQVREGLVEAVRVERVETEYGSMSRYYFVDFDFELNELYVYDASEDWKLYGMSYSMDGDAIKIDFESKKRKKYAIVDFVEGTTEDKAAFAVVIEEMAEQYHELTELHSATKAELATANEELDALRKYKADASAELCEFRVAEMREKFADLAGIEEFEILCEHIGEYEKSEFEDKCYAVRGKNVAANFSKKTDSVRLPVMKHDEETENEPYGGLFTKFAKKA